LGGNSIVDSIKAKRAYLSQNITSTESNIFALVARNLSSTGDTNAYASMQWRETR